MKHSEHGMAVVLVLMIMALVTAMVVEFAAASYTASAVFSNWRNAQQLSLAARSGITLLSKTVSDNYGRYSYTYPGIVTTPVANALGDFHGLLQVTAEDENAKFNVNALVFPNGELNTAAYDSLKRLLKQSELDAHLADRIADWIDRDHEPRLADSEKGAKNGYLDSVDELRLIIDPESCKTLLPLVTVYGMGDVYAGTVNINTAPIPVLMSLDDAVTRELAERIVEYRSVEPFKAPSDIVKVAGFEGALGQSLQGRIAVKASNFRFTSEASEDRIRRIIQCVVRMQGTRGTIQYWQET